MLIAPELIGNRSSCEPWNFQQLSLDWPDNPYKQPVTVASKRSRQRVTFSWMLWNIPATLRTVRSLVWEGVGRPSEQRGRGVFAAFSADRVSGAKGKLSFAPSQGVW